MGSKNSNEEWPTLKISPEHIKVEKADVSVEVKNQYSRDNPAKILVEFTNLIEERMISFAGTPPFCDLSTTNEDGNELFLIADDQDSIYLDAPEPLIPEKPINGCWRIPEGNLAETLARPIVTLEKEESVSRVYSLLDGRNDICLPTGSYRFKEEDYFEGGESFGFDVALLR